LELPEINETSCDLREYFILGYATSLLSHPSLWQIGLQYLSYCPVYGGDFIEHYLVHIPFTNEIALRKLLQASRDYNCIEAFKLLNRIAAQQAFKRKRYGDAIIYLLDAEASFLISRVCDEILKNYVSTGAYVYLFMMVRVFSH
jgi:nuclear pore complex protein Nup85